MRNSKDLVLFSMLIFGIFISNYLSGQNWKEFKRNQDKNWALGKVFMTSGEVFEAELQLLVSFTEGTLQVRNGDQVKSLTPRQVGRFEYFDSSFNRTREFVSVPSKVRDHPGSKNIFLELIYEGKEYSLMARYLPVVKLGSLVVPLPNWSVGYAIWSYGRIEEAMFVYVNGDYAYQVTKRVSYLDKQLETTNPERIDYKFDKYILKEIFGEQLPLMMKQCRQNRLDFNTQRGFTEAIKLANESDFTYNRKDTPKKLRNY